MMARSSVFLFRAANIPGEESKGTLSRQGCGFRVVARALLAVEAVAGAGVDDEFARVLGGGFIARSFPERFPPKLPNFGDKEALQNV